MASENRVSLFAFSNSPQHYVSGSVQFPKLEAASAPFCIRVLRLSKLPAASLYIHDIHRAYHTSVSAQAPLMAIRPMMYADICDSTREARPVHIRCPFRTSLLHYLLRLKIAFFFQSIDVRETLWKDRQHRYCLKTMAYKKRCQLLLSTTSILAVLFRLALSPPPLLLRSQCHYPSSVPRQCHYPFFQLKRLIPKSLVVGTYTMVSYTWHLCTTGLYLTKGRIASKAPRTADQSTKTMQILRYDPSHTLFTTS